MWNSNSFVNDIENDLPLFAALKKQEKKEVSYSVELIGILLILIGIIGFGFGPVGLLIKKFAMFLILFYNYFTRSCFIRS